MVFEDQYNKVPVPYREIEQARNAQEIAPGEIYPLAHPRDRFGAFVIDIFSVLIPVIFFVTAPIKKKILTSSLLSMQEQAMIFTLLFSSVSLMVFFIYQTVMLWKYGATVGKLFFNLRVINIWSKKSPSFIHSFLRSVVWSLEAFLFFIPNVSILSNYLRRSFHDRIVDTVVVTVKKKNSVNHPNVLERNFVKSIYISVFLFSLLILNLIIGSVKSELKNSFSKYGVTEEESYKVCEDVSKSYSKWSKPKPSRIEVALILFGTSTISKDCFQKEADYSFENGKNNEALAYLSQLLLSLSRGVEELSNNYIQKICSLESSVESCLLAKSLNLSTDEYWDKIVNTLDINTSSTYFKVWTLRRFVDEEKYSRVEEILANLKPENEISEYTTKVRAQSYFASRGGSHFRIAERMAFEMLPQSSATSFSSWSCYHQLNNSCKAEKSLSCESFRGYVRHTLKPIVEPLYVVTYAKLLDCDKSTENKFHQIFQTLKTNNSKIYTRSLHEYEKGNLKDAFEVWELFIKKPEISDAYKLDILNRWLVYYTQQKDDKKVLLLLGFWKNLNTGLAWQNLGYNFLNYFEVKDNSKSIYSMASRILKYKNKSIFRNKNLNKKLVMAMAKLGKREQAWAYYKKSLLSIEHQRSLASVVNNNTAFEKTVQKLSKEFGGP